MIKLGIEKLIEKPPFWIKNKKLGLLCNQASVNSQLIHSRFLIKNKFNNKLKILFSPQHGLFSEKQDNMKESVHSFDTELNIPIFSLYSETRTPTDEALELIDILLIDLQDCGTRVYTYIWTMLLAMKKCAEKEIAVCVLDRPNPIGGDIVEGNILWEDLYSFVGLAPLPMRHGLTIGELALFFRDYFNLDLELHIIKMEGWQRRYYFDETGLTWVLPSPNMPHLQTAIVYPGQVILEGTNLSEGRGTTRPFEIFGAPYLNVNDFLKQLGEVNGAILRFQAFEPTFNKWQGKRCLGAQVHITNRNKFKPYRFTLKMLNTLFKLQDEISWTAPPYEYNYVDLPADLIIGNKTIRLMVESGADFSEIEEVLERDEKKFLELRAPFLLYR